MHRRRCNPKPQRQFARVQAAGASATSAPNRRRRRPAPGSLRHGGFFTAVRRTDQPRPVQDKLLFPVVASAPSEWSSELRSVGPPPIPRRLRVPQAARGGDPALPIPTLAAGDRRQRHVNTLQRENFTGRKAGRRQRRNRKLLRPGSGGDPEHRGDLRRQVGASPSSSADGATCTSVAADSGVVRR